MLLQYARVKSTFHLICLRSFNSCAEWSLYYTNYSTLAGYTMPDWNDKSARGFLLLPFQTEPLVYIVRIASGTLLVKAVVKALTFNNV